MKTITLSMRSVRKAIAQAHETTDDWQADMLGILSIPAIHQRWQELNANMRGLRLDRVGGLPHKECTPDMNQAIGKDRVWAKYAGYEVVLASGVDSEGKEWVSRWNSIREDWFSHSPSCAWNGISRNTICQFLESIRMIALGYHHPEDYKRLANAKIKLTGLPQVVAA